MRKILKTTICTLCLFLGVSVALAENNYPQSGHITVHDESSSGGRFINFTNVDTGNGGVNFDGVSVGLDGAGDMELRNNENSDVYFFVNGAKRMTIDPNGNVGIGNFNPTDLLHIDQPDVSYRFSPRYLAMETKDTVSSAWDHYPYIAFYADGDRGGYLGYGTPGEVIKLQLENGNDFAIQGGNVGIGIANPSELLEVAGPGKFSDGVGVVEIDGIADEAENGHVRGSILFSRNGDLAWDEVNDTWTIGISGNSNDFAAILHSFNGNLEFFGGLADSMIAPMNNDDFRSTYQRMTITGEGNVGIGTRIPTDLLQIDQPDVSYRFSPRYLALETKDTVSSAWDHYPYIAFFADGNRGAFFGYGTPGDVIELRLENGNDFAIMDGNVGIGTTNPTERLVVDGLIKAGKMVTGSWPSNQNNPFWGASTLDQTVNTNYALLQAGAGGNAGRTFLNSPLDLRFRIGNDDKMVVTNSGDVGIGTVNPAEKLAVDGNATFNGTVYAKEVTVDLTIPWSDYVFSTDYDLPSLNEVASFIEKNNHLPDIPSAKEVEKNGLKMAEMMAKQMQKIEELTLYMIEMQKENEALKERLAALEAK